MRFIIMHRTNAHWESGAVPGPGLVARVGALLGDMGKAGVLVAGEGLRPSSEGARLIIADARRTVVKGPFAGDREAEGFSIVRASSLEDAIEWAAKEAVESGDVEIDIRPVTEPWDIGMGPRPPDVTTRRFMVLRKAAATGEGGAPHGRATPGWSRLVDEAPGNAEQIASARTRPRARGRRYTNSVDGVSVFDGPFAETTELLGGYVIVSTESFDAADGWARRYVEAVHAEQVDLRELM